MSKNVWLYFGTSSRTLMIPASRLRGMHPDSDGTLELTFDSIVNTINAPTDKVSLNLFEDNTHLDVIKAITRAIHNETPTFDGFVTVADQTTSPGFHVPEFLTDRDGTEVGTIVSINDLVIQDTTVGLLVATTAASYAAGTLTPRAGVWYILSDSAGKVVHLPACYLGARVEYITNVSFSGCILACEVGTDKINNVDGEVGATIPSYATRVIATGMGATEWLVSFYNELGYLDSVGNGFDAPDLTNLNNEALDIVATGAAVNITGSGVNIAGGSGEIDLTTTGALDVNSNTLDVDVTAAATIDAVGIALGAGSGELDLTTTGTLDINSNVITINSSFVTSIDTNGLSIDNVGTAANITNTTDGVGEDFTISLAGATDSSLILSSTGTGADALQLTTTAGGIDITSTGAAAGEDIDISTNASVNITSTEDTANAILLSATTGGIQIQALDGGTGSSDVTIVADEGAVNIQSTQSAGDAITLLATTGGIDITAAGASAGEDIDITATGSSINLTSTEAIASAIVLNASNASGGIDITAGSSGSVDIGGGSVSIDNRKDELAALTAITDAAITVAYGKEYIVNDGNGGAMVLPACGTGKRITIIIGTILTGDLTITAAATDQLFKGYAIMEATDVANNKTLFQPDGTDDDVITLNGSTTGGLVGDKIELVGISALHWRVRATMSHTGSAATPFS